MKGAGFKVGIGTMLFTGSILYLSEMKFYFQCAYLMIKNNFICCILKYIFTFYAVDIFRFSVNGVGIQLMQKFFHMLN